VDTIVVTGLYVGLTALVSLFGLFFTEARKRRLGQKRKALRAAVQTHIDVVLHSKSLSPVRSLLERISAEVNLAPSDLSRLVSWRDQEERGAYDKGWRDARK
jgi:pantothenate kinase-related protein Tda10